MASRSRFAGAGEFLPAAHDAELAELASAARHCKGCDLFHDATQTVFGQGPRDATMVLVGEQPGDVEDKKGRPFVGPAGALLRQALRAAEIDPEQVYLTNAVKHFRWRAAPTGSRRLHRTPGATHVRACRPWLAAELSDLSPTVIVALGATAVVSLVGSDTKLTTIRGQLRHWSDVATTDLAGEDPHIPSNRLRTRFLATVHPSAVLRAQDRDALFDGLVADLRTAAAAT